MYDLNGNGFIDRSEMSTIFDAFLRLVGPLQSLSGKKSDSAQQLTSEFFDTMDTNADGKISLDEYKEGALKNPDIIQGLKLFNK
jgi:Ca2+-binding EF-hand superfamily protein